MRISKKRAASAGCCASAVHPQTRIARIERKRPISPGSDYRKYSACRAGPLLSLRDPVEFRSRADDEAAARDGRGRHAHFAQRVLAQHLELLPRLHHEGIAILAQGENPAV